MANVTMSRRSLVQAAGAAAAATALAAVPAFADSAPAGMVPGTYTATKHGYMHDNTVFVTVSENAIESVSVISEELPEYVRQFPVKCMPERIVKAQSLDVDVVSGATFTSMAIIAGVRDCIEQAGGAGMFEDAPVKPEKTQAETVETDVLVIGGGIGGCVAALSAAQNDFDQVESGVRVTMLEKQDFIGGSTIFSFGGCFTVTPLSEPPAQSYIDSEIARIESLEPNVVRNVPLLTHLLGVAGDTAKKLHELGVPFSTTGLEEPLDHLEPTFNGDPYVMYPAGLDWKKSWGVAGHYMDVLNKYWDVLGIDVRLRTAATELIVEDGAIVGARVEDPTSTYEIRAKKTILATGGIAQNKELLEQWAPHDADALPWCSGGSDGDGQLMGVAVGGRIVGDRTWAHIAVNNITGFHDETWGIIMDNGFLVNKLGEKFVDNGNDNSLSAALTAEQPDKCAFSVVDGDNPYVGILEEGLASGYYDGIVFKGETVEEMAEAAGIEPVALQAAIDAYNEHLETRGDSDWRRYDYWEDPEFAGALPIQNGPFYAVKFVQVAPATCVSLVVDGDCKVLNDADEPIANLYAIGECCIGGNIFDLHFGGWGNGGAMYSGRIAGEDAKAAILA